jgi:hypothetical protein
MCFTCTADECASEQKLTKRASICLGHFRGEDTKRNLRHVKDREAPAGQFGDEDYFDLAACPDARTFLRFGALLLRPGAGGRFPSDPYDFLASLLGEGA